MKQQQKISQKRERELAWQELKILEAEVAAARNFLRKNYKNYFSGKKQLPIHLILGPSHFGKTTLLAHAGLNLKNFNHQNLDHVTPTKYCSFWFSPDALYIDTAGTYTKPDVIKPRNDLIWPGFIKLLQKYFGKDAISEILIILDLPAITKDSMLLKKTLFHIRERIYELSALIHSLPLHIIFTKCDRIAGFTDFFHLLTPEERKQSFGIAFTNKQEQIDPTPVFEKKFNELLKRLSELTIKWLQRSNNADERSLIKSFPSQLSYLTPIIIEILSKIPSGQQILLSGIYFTSSIQMGIPDNILKQALFTAFALKEKHHYKLELNDSGSYFVEDLFKKTIALIRTARIATAKGKRHFHPNHLLSVLAAVLITIATCTIGYKNYHSNITAMNKLKNLLLIHIPIASIDNLHDNIIIFNKNSQSLWLKLGPNETTPLLRKLHRTHQVAFLQMLRSQLENCISAAIISSEPKSNPRKFYNTLRAYLMLGDTTKLNKNYIKEWFKNYWEDIYKNDKTQQIKLQQQLDFTIQLPFKVELNSQTIALAREKLNSLPSTILFYLMLEDLYNNQSTKIYTAEHFNEIYNKKIPELIDKLTSQDWVLGDISRLKAKNSIDKNNLIEIIKNIYLEKYISTWENIALNPEIKIDAKNPLKAAYDLKILASNNSPLFKLLQQIKTNINIKNSPENFNKIINEKLQAYIKINPAELQRELEKLASQFESLAKNKDRDLIFFSIVENNLLNPPDQQLDLITNLKTFAKNQPAPSQNWVQIIIKNIWPVLLDGSYNHINKTWQSVIIPQYQKTLNNKYPLFKNSKEDITLDDFNRFFGPHGTINNFFNQYIKPFIDISKTGWSWKILDDQQIKFSHEALEIFLRAALIQKMFYTNKTSSPKINFTLSPMDLTLHTQGFELHLDGQKLIFSSTNKLSYNLTWPGPSPGLVMLDFIDRDGKYFSASQFGLWAWFRMIDKSILVPTSNTKHFTITFDLNGNSAKYELTTDEAINPFIPEIINKFRCPNKLV
jgi:type VI secretion system protein ImpL